MAPVSKRQRLEGIMEYFKHPKQTDKLRSCIESILRLDPISLKNEIQSVEDSETLFRILDRLVSLKLEIERQIQIRQPNFEQLKKTYPRNSQQSQRKCERHLCPVEKHDRIPTEVIRQVSSSNFLRPEELGRFLLITSKSISNDLGGSPAVWRELCHCKWRNSIYIPQVVIEKRGYQWIFQQRLKLLAKQRSEFPELPKPKLQPEALEFWVSINNERKELVSEVLKGPKLEQLLKTGEVDWTLSEPVPICDSPSEVSVTDVSQFSKLSATIHAVRLDTCQCSCIHQTTSREWWGWQRNQVYTTLNKDNNLPLGCLGFRSSYIGLAVTDNGEALARRMAKVDDPGGRFEDSDPYEGFNFEVTLLCVESKGLNDGSKKSLVTRLKISAKKFFKSGQHKVFDSRKEVKTHGVSLLHLLEELYGWDESSSSFPRLRFDIGSRVLCRMGPNPIEDWAKGTIVQLWYREAKWWPESLAPYKIRLDEGHCIFAPADLDRVIRRAA